MPVTVNPAKTRHAGNSTESNREESQSGIIRNEKKSKINEEISTQLDRESRDPWSMVCVFF